MIEGSKMSERHWALGRRLLLMGSSAYKEEELPLEVRKRIDEALALKMTMIVGEARGACRRFQDYLSSRGYEDVIVGHAKSIRYNASGWRTLKYGDDLKEREQGMIEDCDSAIIIWMDNSSVIAKNLETLKKLDKPTYVYELSTKENTASFGMIDPTRSYYRSYGIRARVDVDKQGLSEFVDSFLRSDDAEVEVKCEKPELTGYHLNKLLLEKGVEDVLEVRLIPGSCFLARRNT